MKMLLAALALVAGAATAVSAAESQTVACKPVSKAPAGALQQWAARTLNANLPKRLPQDLIAGAVVMPLGKTVYVVWLTGTSGCPMTYARRDFEKAERKSFGLEA